MLKNINGANILFGKSVSTHDSNDPVLLSYNAYISVIEPIFDTPI